MTGNVSVTHRNKIGTFEARFHIYGVSKNEKSLPHPLPPAHNASLLWDAPHLLKASYPFHDYPAFTLSCFCHDREKEKTLSTA